MLSRRQFLQLTSWTAGSAVLLSACGPSGNTTVPEAAAGELFMDFPANNVEQWSRIPADHQLGSSVTQEEWYEILGNPPEEAIEIAGFKGGWGESWIDAVIESLEADFPGIKINKDFDPRIWEKMKPRLVAGEVPDWNYYVLGPWGGDWKTGIEENLIIPGDFLLDVEGYNLPGRRVGDLIAPGAASAANGGLEGQWSFPLSQSVYGIYYNVDLFETNGWPHPGDLSWEEFMELCQEIADSGVPPFTYPGKYPSYFSSGVLQSLWYKKGGEQALCDMDNLVEGAFMNPDLIWGVEQIQRIFSNGWIFPGSEAMTHTESQQIFVDGKCAMIPNGSWMPNEQKETTPEDFRMKLSSVPAPADGKGFAKAVQFSEGVAELQIGNGKNPLWGMEVMRRIYSATVQQIFAEEIGSPSAMVSVLENTEVSEAWESAAKAISDAEGHNVIINYGKWYPELGKRFTESLGDVWFSKISAEEAMGLLERSAEDIRADSTITKYTRECKA